MPDFQDVRVRMEDKHVGPFMRWLRDNCPYPCSPCGSDVIGPPKQEVQKLKLLAPPPSKDEEPKKGGRPTYPYTYSRRKSMMIWLRMYDLIKGGVKSLDELTPLAGYKDTPHTAVRVLNTLKRHGYVKGTDGAYTVSKELNESMLKAGS